MAEILLDRDVDLHIFFHTTRCGSARDDRGGPGACTGGGHGGERRGGGGARLQEQSGGETHQPPVGARSVSREGLWHTGHERGSTEQSIRRTGSGRLILAKGRHLRQLVTMEEQAQARADQGMGAARPEAARTSAGHGALGGGHSGWRAGSRARERGTGVRLVVGTARGRARR
jgi:hypothetical protein